MILVTRSSVTVEKDANMGGGESGVICCKFRKVEKFEHIFSIFFCKEHHKSVIQKLRGIY